jgi:hypothetical protein
MRITDPNPPRADAHPLGVCGFIWCVCVCSHARVRVRTLLPISTNSCGGNNCVFITIASAANMCENPPARNQEERRQTDHNKE